MIQLRESVSIVGNNEIVREGLRRILTEASLKVVETTSDPDLLSGDGEPAGYPHLIVIDAFADPTAIETCTRIRDRFPTARIVLLADACDRDSVVAALRAGVDGYLIRQISCEPLVSALHLVALGEKVVPSDMIASIVDFPRACGPADFGSTWSNVNLSEREIDVLRRLADGEANKVISRRLGITEATVKVHIKAILRKLHLSNRTQAAIWAVTTGLSDPPAAASGDARLALAIA